MNPEDFALVVGINQYPGLPPGKSLKAAEADARKFFDWVTAEGKGGVSQEAGHARLILSSDYPQTADPLDAHPVKRDIDRVLRDWGVHAGQRVGRRLYFYFAGHGLGLTFDEIALLMGDAAPQMFNNNLGLSEYRRYLRQAAPFDQVVILVDCCRELDERVAPQPPMFTLVTREDAAADVQDFLALATRFGKRAYEPAPAEGGEARGLFTAVLLEGLEGKAADRLTGKVTANSLRDYLTRRLPEYAQQFQRVQRPEFEGNASDLVFYDASQNWPEVQIDVPPEWPGPLAILDGYGDELHQRADNAGPWTLRLRDGQYEVRDTASGRRCPLRVSGGQARLGPEEPVSFDMRPATGTLVVNSPLSLAEILVSDQDGNLVARSLGNIEQELPAGDYRIDVALADGRASHSAHVAAGQRRELHESDWQGARFTSAAPLTHSSTSHEDHAGPAQHFSRTLTWPASSGDSRLFLFARTVDRAQFPLVVTGLSLLRGDGLPVTELQTGVASDAAAGWLAFTADLPAGPYLLAYRPPPVPGAVSSRSERRERGAGPARFQPVWLCPGFETHLFVPGRERLYLEDLFVSMANKGAGFRSNDFETAAVEVVLDGLQRGRNLASGQQLQQLLRDKFTNPWLGILAVHALRLDPQPNAQLIEIALGNLQGMLGSEHPDLRALALKMDQPAGRAIDFPPMLRASLQLVQRHSVAHGATISPDSLTSRIYDGLLADSPWSAWGDLEAAQAKRRKARDVVRLARVFDQRGQTVIGPQTNIAGDVTGPVLSGKFEGPVNVGDITVGNITGATGVAIGHGAQAQVSVGGRPRSDPLAGTFAPLEARVNALPAGAAREDAQDALQKLLGEARKGGRADEGRVQRCLKTLEEVLPGITELARAQFTQPGSGVGPVLARAVQPPGEKAAESGPPRAALTELQRRFTDWESGQTTEAISQDLGLPWARVLEARLDLARPDLFDRELGPVEASIFRYLWDRFEFEVLSAPDTRG